MREERDPMKAHIVIPTILVILTLAACTTQVQVQTPTPAPTVNDAVAIPSQTAQSTATATAKPITAVTATPAPSPVVIIQSEANLPKSDVDSLRKKVVEPFLEYYKISSKEQGNLVTLKIEINTNQQSVKDYPYKAEAIFSNGGNMGFLVTKNNSTIDWWVPECMGGACPFTPEFKTKYPEIVAKSEAK